MPSITRSLKIPELLMQALEQRARQLGYTSFNGYMKGLVRYDLMCQGEHSLTIPINQATGRQQDKVDAWLLRVARRGIGARGVLLNHIVERMQARGQTSLEAILEAASDDSEEWSHWDI